MPGTAFANSREFFVCIFIEMRPTGDRGDSAEGISKCSNALNVASSRTPAGGGGPQRRDPFETNPRASSGRSSRLGGGRSTGIEDGLASRIGRSRFTPSKCCIISAINGPPAFASSMRRSSAAGAIRSRHRASCGAPAYLPAFVGNCRPAVAAGQCYSGTLRPAASRFASFALHRLPSRVSGAGSRFFRRRGLCGKAFGDLPVGFPTTPARPGRFVLAVAVVVAWIAVGPWFHYSDTWQLVINTGTTIVTFLMVFLIQNTQNRDAMVMQLKLDELLRAVEEARTGLVALEDVSDETLTAIEKAIQRAGRKFGGRTAHHRRLTGTGDGRSNRLAHAAVVAGGQVSGSHFVGAGVYCTLGREEIRNACPLGCPRHGWPAGRISFWAEIGYQKESTDEQILRAITREQLIKNLNGDLAREYQAVIAYVTYSQVLKGAQYMNIARELELTPARSWPTPC